MERLFDPERLPPPLRAQVQRALSDRESYEAAIAALEQHLAAEAGGGPDARVALALLLFEEASQLVLSQVGPAAERALALIEEARQRGASETEALARLRRACSDALSAERRRERDLAVRVAFGNAEPFEEVLLGRRRLERGDDAVAAALMRRAGERD